jgi:hypothetical protein
VHRAYHKFNPTWARLIKALVSDTVVSITENLVGDEFSSLLARQLQFMGKWSGQMAMVYLSVYLSIFWPGPKNADYFRLKKSYP